MKLETVVCIKDFLEYRNVMTTLRFTKDKKYSVMDDSEQSIQIIDDYDRGIAMQRRLFDGHFKYLSDVRDDKLKEIGI
jgi:hypothetical protein